MKQKYSEKKLVIEFCKALKRRGTPFAVEVPYFNRSIDLVYIKNEKICAVEFKIGDWKGAIKQAKSHLIAADEVFICLPETQYSNKLEKLKPELERNHCGLLLFNMKTKEIQQVHPPEDTFTWERGNSLLREGFQYSLANKNYQQLAAL